MRYPASEKLEIIRLVEQSPLPVRRTLTKLGMVEPAPADHLEISEIGLPQLVGCGGLVFERVGLGNGSHSTPQE